MKGRASMENDDLERMYWFTVMDSAKLLTTAHIGIDVFLSDVYDSVVSLNSTDPAVLDLLSILDQISQQREIKNANTIAEQVFKAWILWFLWL